MTISKKKRFEIFKRDDFTCQYCGRQSPIVVLEIDHIIPISKGGEKDNPNNLITSCFDCNRGKKDIPLHLKNITECRQEEIEKIKERNEQIKEYEKFKIKQKQNEQKILDDLNHYWSNLCEHIWSLNESGLNSIRQFLKSLTPEEIKESMLIASQKIEIKYKSDIESRFRYLCGICHTKIRIKSGDNGLILYGKMKKYYLSKNRGSGYFVKYRLKQICQDYSEDIIFDAINVAFSKRQSNYWNAFCDALSELSGDEVNYI